MIVFDSDDKKFGGSGRNEERKKIGFTSIEKDVHGMKPMIKIYIPSRVAMVFKPTSK